MENKQSPARVYAADNPAYAAGHGFRWSTAEGIDLGFTNDPRGKELAELIVPISEAPRLEIPVYVYQLPGDSFEPLPHVAPFGHNFASTQPVAPLSVESFPDVLSAVEFYGGVVRIKD